MLFFLNIVNIKCLLCFLDVLCLFILMFFEYKKDDVKWKKKIFIIEFIVLCFLNSIYIC